MSYWKNKIFAKLSESEKQEIIEKGKDVFSVFDDFLGSENPTRNEADEYLKNIKKNPDDVGKICELTAKCAMQGSEITTLKEALRTAIAIINNSTVPMTGEYMNNIEKFNQVMQKINLGDEG